jgi:hypothetical protein
MKPGNTTAKTFAFAAVTALALGITPTAKADNKGCSIASLNGTFAYTSTGFGVTSPAPPEAEVGTQTFDGRGNTTAAATLVDANGGVHQLTITGTYTVNPDCTGTFTLLVAQFGVTVPVFFVLDDNLNGFQAIQTGGHGVVTRMGRRQFAVGDWRQ